MLMRVTNGGEDQGFRCVGTSIEAVRQLCRDKHRIPALHRVILLANFDHALPADDVDDVVAGMGVEGKETARLHLHQIQSNLVPGDTRSRDADTAADSRQLLAVVVE